VSLGPDLVISVTLPLDRQLRSRADLSERDGGA
jgi:hypothetical protein